MIGLKASSFAGLDRRIGGRTLPRIDVPLELTLGDPAVDGPAVDPQLPSDAGFGEALLQIVCE